MFFGDRKNHECIPFTCLLTTTLFQSNQGTGTRLEVDFMPDPLTPEARQAVRSGDVEVKEKSRTGASYYCNLCSKPLTGEQPLNQHVTGKDHNKKLQARTVAQVRCGSFLFIFQCSVPAL